MICPPCSTQEHVNCVDVNPLTSGFQRINNHEVLVVAELKEGRLYRSCMCQHRVDGRKVAGPGAA